MSEFIPARIAPGGPIPLPPEPEKTPPGASGSSPTPATFPQEVPVTPAGTPPAVPPDSLPPPGRTEGTGDPLPGVAPSRAVIGPLQGDDAPPQATGAVDRIASVTPGSSVAVTPVPAAAPPPPRTPVLGAPRVVQYDEQAYTCREGDTYQSISKRVYQSELYGEALWSWNRNHPQNRNGERRSPSLVPGEVIYLPPVWMLEDRSPDAIPGSTARRPTSRETAALTSAAPPPASPLPTYTVTAPNEWLATIARKALGDSMRWGEIYQLNPTVSSERPIPVGTVLLLPRNTAGGGGSGSP